MSGENVSQGEQTVIPGSGNPGMSRLEQQRDGGIPTIDDDALAAARAADEASKKVVEPAKSSVVEPVEPTTPQSQESVETTEPVSSDPLDPNPKMMRPKKAQDWKAMKELHQKEVNALKAEINELKKTPQHDLAELTKERDSLRDTVRETMI